jgi:hypothetical protein
MHPILGSVLPSAVKISIADGELKKQDLRIRR